MNTTQKNSTPSARPFDMRKARVALVALVALAAIYWQGWLILRLAMGAATAAMAAAAVGCGVLTYTKQEGQRTKYCLAAIGLVCIATIAWWLTPGGLRNTAAPNQSNAVEMREAVKRVLQNNFSQHKQELFNKLHPIGTAQRVVVHDVDIHWKPGASERDLREALSIDTRFTIYWSGPINKDGYTYVSATYEVEPGRSHEIVLATNGTLNEQLPEIGFNLGFLVGSMFQGGAQ